MCLPLDERERRWFHFYNVIMYISPYLLEVRKTTLYLCGVRNFMLLVVPEMAIFSLLELWIEFHQDL